MKANCYKTVVPLKRPFSTSRFTSTKSTNYIFEIEDEEVVGVGEAAARGIKLTGDKKSKLPHVVEEMLLVVNSSCIDYTDRCSALNSVKDIYGKLEKVAQKNSTEENREKPFRGILSGLDIALLDLCAKKLNIKVSELLGQKRNEAYVSASTLSASKKPSEVTDRLRKQAEKFDAFRCKGAADNGENIERLSLMRQVNQELNKNNVYWLDLNEALSPDEAVKFVKLVASWIKEGGVGDEVVILEQPVNKDFYKELCELQVLCNSLLPAEGGKIVIMADESLWDLEDFKRLSLYGGCGAINIKVPKVGGLLNALELARYVEENSPETMVYIGGMIGTSDIMGRAIYNLYKSLPRVDFCTTSPARNVSVNLADVPLRYRSSRVNEVLLGELPGLGTGLDYRAMNKSIYEGGGGIANKAISHTSDTGASVNYYENQELLEFSQKELDSHLIEREALLAGFVTERLSGSRFSCVDPDKGRSLTFFWTMAAGISKSTREACKKKAIAKEMFRRAGAPIAEGSAFRVSDDPQEAVRYAEELGWPVVVKPGIGTGGVGVTANITSSKDLVWAIRNIKDNKLADSRNDDTYVLEKHVLGKELRVFVAGGRAVGAIERIQPHVIGDGVSSVRQLIDIKNKMRARNPRLSNSKLKKGKSTEFQLERQGKTLSSVPGSGELVTTSPVFSISQGADTRSVINEVHPTVLEAAVKAVSGVEGLHETGVDFILEDYKRPIHGQQACVCEVNASPSIAAAHFPMYGDAVNVAKEFLCSVIGRRWGYSAGRFSAGSGRVCDRGIIVDVYSNTEGKILKEIFVKALAKRGVDFKIISTSRSIRVLCSGDLDKVLACPSALSKCMLERDVKDGCVISFLWR
ncbi:enolase C-terminal domain-like protein [Halomonas mongoliensis]|uniref:enolase C-terminal domain-like protein n=1 Tax=Halomonas mongoliensis TaxID=321265 RepID=UPI00403ABDCE